MNDDDRRWLAAAAALSARGRPLSRPNPSVGCLIVKDNAVIARGWTLAGGRPHAEAAALAQAGEAAHGATLYVTLEPCAHVSPRGPACAGLVAASGAARVVVGVEDPDPRTAGRGIAQLRESGMVVELADDPACRTVLAGFLTRQHLGRPHVTLKLATSLDGCIALADGTSQWITGGEARAHVHAMRARADAILVGGGTLRADMPRLDVRLPGLEARSPKRFVLSRSPAPEGWEALSAPQEIAAMEGIDYLFVEGGAGAAATFLQADLVDRLLIYRAPIAIGGGRLSIAEFGLGSLGEAHGRWRVIDRRQLGSDSLEVYERSR